MPYVNGALDETKWLLWSKYNLDTLYITLYVIGWEFSINRKIILNIDADFQDCMHILNCIHWKDSPMVLLNSCIQHYEFRSDLQSG